MISLSHQDFWKEPIRSVTCFCVTHRDSMVSTARTVARSIQHRFLGRPPGPATCLLLPTTQCLLHPAHPTPHTQLHPHQQRSLRSCPTCSSIILTLRPSTLYPLVFSVSPLAINLHQECRATFTRKTRGASVHHRGQVSAQAIYV